jgi:hypothetical protein
MSARNFTNSWCRWRRWHDPMTWPVATSRAAKSEVVPCRTSSWVPRSACPGVIGRTGWVRSRAWTWLFSSTLRTTARSGGLRYNPTTSRTFSTKYGSVDSLNASCRWGRRPNARQIRLTAVWDRPVALAMPRVLQWVAAAGLDSSVRVTTSSTWASVMVRGGPGRGSSVRPSSRRARNRCRHFPTVGRVTRRSAAVAVLDRPSAAARTMLARRASRWADFGRRAQAVSLARSSSVRVSGVRGRPADMGHLLPEPYSRLGGGARK